jgi:hypothetical protein
MLPDDVLMGIFDFYEDNWRNTWHALVHVCQRWRYLVFASPRHLDLRLKYRGHRPMSEVLDAWPVLPLSLILSIDQSERWDNIVAALESEHSNRISEIYVDVTDSHWEIFAAAMQKPFPELTLLEIWADDVVRVLPESFLAGSAPHLQSLRLRGVPFPSIPKLLLSANRLVDLNLWGIPESGYFSPDAMATALTTMTRLESLSIGFALEFDSPQSRSDPESQPLPPPTRFALPALTQLEFKGVYEYLEGFLVRIDAPLLDDLKIEFFRDLDFDVPQLHRLISHAELKIFERAAVLICHSFIQLHLYPNTVEVDDRRRFALQITGTDLDYQISSLAQVCSSSFCLLSGLEELQIWDKDSLSSRCWKDHMESARWLELLDPFAALKNIYLSKEIATHFCSALQELSGESVTEVLPALRNLYVQRSSLESVQEVMKSFVAARQLPGHPVVVDHW